MAKLTKSDLDKMIEEVLEQPSGKNQVADDINSFSINMQEIIKHYNRRNKTDLQNELKDKIKSTTSEKAMRDLAKDYIDEHQRDEGKDIERTIAQEAQKENIDKNKIDQKQVEEQLKDTTKEEDTKDDTRAAIKQAVIKCAYEATLEEYMAFRAQIEKSQLRDGELSLPNGAYNKMLLYEKYLRKLDMDYKTLDEHGRYISQNDENIAKMENTLDEKREQTKSKILREDDKQIRKIEEIKNRRDEIMQEMAQLSANYKLYGSENLNARMDELQERLQDANEELYNLQPNPVELQHEQTERANDERIRGDQVGRGYIREKAGNIGVQEQNAQREEKQSKAANEQRQETLDGNKETLESLGRDFDRALERGASDEELEQIVESMEVISGSTDDITSEEKKLSKDGKLDGRKKDEHTAEGDTSEKTEIQDERDHKMGIGAVQSSKRVELIRRKREALAKGKADKNPYERDVQNNYKVR